MDADAALSGLSLPGRDAEPWRIGMVEHIAQFKGSVVSFDTREPYYLASCDVCGWVGSTEQCPHDEENVVCPRCLTSGADCGKVAEKLGSALSTVQDGSVREDILAALNSTMEPEHWDGTWEQAIAYAQNAVVDTFSALSALPQSGDKI